MSVMANSKSNPEAAVREGTVSISLPDHLVWGEILGDPPVLPKAKLIANGDMVKIMQPRRDDEGMIAPGGGYHQFDIIRGAQIASKGMDRQVISGESFLFRDVMGMSPSDSQVKIEVADVGVFGG